MISENELELNIDSWVKKGALNIDDLIVTIYPNHDGMDISNKRNTTFYLEYSIDGDVGVRFLDYDVRGIRRAGGQFVYMNIDFKLYDSNFKFTYGITGFGKGDIEAEQRIPFNLTEEQYFQLSTVMEFPLSFEYMKIIITTVSGMLDVLYENLWEL